MGSGKHSELTSEASGWYPDVTTPGFERYWDGANWSHTNRLEVDVWEAPTKFLPKTRALGYLVASLQTLVAGGIVVVALLVAILAEAVGSVQSEGPWASIVLLFGVMGLILAAVGFVAPLMMFKGLIDENRRLVITGGTVGVITTMIMASVFVTSYEGLPVLSVVALGAMGCYLAPIVEALATPNRS